MLGGHGPWPLLGCVCVRNSDPMLSLWMGTAIVGRYVLIGPVGYGGVSVVYQAIDTHRGSRCAVKLLSPAFADDDYARQRVQQEALITTRLRHPSVPQIYDYGDATLPDGRVVPYVAMELLSGAMLAGRLAVPDGLAGDAPARRRAAAPRAAPGPARPGPAPHGRRALRGVHGQAVGGPPGGRAARARAVASGDRPGRRAPPHRGGDQL